MDWAFAAVASPPVRVDLMGRKRHRKGYATFVGTDSVEHLRLLGTAGMPNYSSLLDHLHMAARNLALSGALENGNIASWHPHAFGHSFETEASHAGVKSEIRDYFMSHIGGIQYLYNHRHELHPEDLVEAYRNLEPFLSLNPTQAIVEGRFAEREKTLRDEFEGRLARLEGQRRRGLGTGDRLFLQPPAHPVSFTELRKPSAASPPRLRPPPGRLPRHRG